MYVCVCNAVTDRQIRRAVREDGVRTFAQLQARLNVSATCGRCEEFARGVLAEAVAEALPAAPAGVVLPASAVA